jgi:hypothetical protein
MRASRALSQLLLPLVLCALLLAAFAYFVWPTPWRYDIGKADTQVRVSRLTGEVYVRYPGTNWVRPSDLHTPPELLASMRESMRDEECAYHTVNLARALELYVETHADLPPRHTWLEAILPSVCEAGFDHRVLQCPVRPQLPAGYALNTGACGLNHGEVQDKHRVIVVFESDAGWNASGGPELLPDEPRHQGGDHYGFADGESEWLPRRKNPDGTWAKEPEAKVRWEVGVAETSRGK